MNDKIPGINKVSKERKDHLYEDLYGKYDEEFGKLNKRDSITFGILLMMAVALIILSFAIYDDATQANFKDPTIPTANLSSFPMSEEPSAPCK